MVECGFVGGLIDMYIWRKNSEMNVCEGRWLDRLLRRQGDSWVCGFVGW